ncbi:MAG: DUF4439 domain-containing protein [Frankia sp.]|nr:DUF4439 domain-containing protein [Frankia sp.]
MRAAATTSTDTTGSTGSAPPATATAFPTPDPRAAETLSAVLAVEHAAMYGAASAGGALAPLGAAAGPARELARAAYAAHRQLRDTLTGLVLAAGGNPPAALPAYELPVDPHSVEGALALLADLDERTAAASFDALGSLTGPVREILVDALAQAALRAQRARLTAGEQLPAPLRALPGHP